MFLTLDGTSIIQLINFAIFFAILNVVFLRPVGAAIRKRREYIDSVKSDYDRYAQQIAALRAAAEQGRLAARREAEEIVSRERSDAEREAAQIVGAKTHEAGQIADEARATVASELDAARAREPELAGALAATLLDRALGNAR
jgi:F0F1-type ATP synthase membrane subunit b/b'